MDKNDVFFEVNNLESEDYIQSANTLFHFMKDFRFLKMALQNKALGARFCVEDISYLNLNLDGKPTTKIAVLVKCFCDIPLTMAVKPSKVRVEESSVKEVQAKTGYSISSVEEMSHTDFYGSFGIAFSKKWCKDKNIQPVHYLEPTSYYTQQLGSYIQEQIDQDSISDLDFEDAFLRLSYIKPLRGTMSRNKEFLSKNKEDKKKKKKKKKKKNKKDKNKVIKQEIKIFYQKNFHNEKEWRFVPKMKDIQTIFPEEYPVILNDETARKIDIDQKYADHRSNALAAQEVCSLLFEYEDIRYLIVPGATERRDLIKFIDSLSFDGEHPQDDKYLLCSKIITLDEVRKDM